jgi:CDP-4-dehydro-6-deoxyglucose reductase
MNFIARSMQTLPSRIHMPAAPAGDVGNGALPKTRALRQPINGVVSAVARPTSNVTILKVRVEPDTPFCYVPGQYINVIGSDSRMRSYSLARAEVLDGCIELHVGRMQGGIFSDEAMRLVKEGDPFSWLGPYGDFGWHPNAGKRAIFVCTGTGFAPIRALLERAIDAADSVPIVLYWGARKLSDLYARALLIGWACEHPNFEFVPVLSEGVAIEGSSIRRGHVHQVVVEDFDSLQDAMVYACGSPRMVDSARRAFMETRGLPESAFFSDPFGETESLPGSDATEHDGALIQIAVSGAAHTVRGNGTLLGALKRACVRISSVCGGQRACGTCVVEIEPAWRDKLAGPTDEELDLLTFTPDATSSCRLACQIKLDSTMNGLCLRVR